MNRFAVVLVAATMLLGACSSDEDSAGTVADQTTAQSTDDQESRDAASSSMTSADDETTTSSPDGSESGTTDDVGTTSPGDPATTNDVTQPPDEPTTSQMTPPSTAKSSTTTTTTLRTVDGSAAERATGLAADPHCDDVGRAVVTLSWQPSSTLGDEQRIEMTIAPRSFDEGTVGPAMKPGASSTDWYELSGQATHVWRVVTRHGDRWVASATSEFQGPLCVVDQPA